MDSTGEMNDHLELVRPLFEAKQNNVAAVLATVGQYINIHRKEFFNEPNWEMTLLSTFRQSAINDEPIQNDSRYSLNASIPASQEAMHVRNPIVAKPTKNITHHLVLATTPEPSLAHPASLVNVPDEDDISFDIPETQHFTQKLVAPDDDDSSDSFFQVQPTDFNTCVAETQSQLLPDSRSNSPKAAAESDQRNFAKLFNATLLDDGDETDCEEELNEFEKSINASLVNRVVSGSVTPDLVFEAVMDKEDAAEPTLPPRRNWLDSLDEEIPVSQVAVRDGLGGLDWENSNSTDLFDAQTQPFVRDPKTRLSLKRKLTVYDEPTQRPLTPKKSGSPSNATNSPASSPISMNMFELPTQPFKQLPKRISATKKKSLDRKADMADNEPTPAFVRLHPVDADDVFYDAETQMFVPPSTSPTIKSESDDDIFNQPTQKLPKARSSSLSRPVVGKETAHGSPSEPNMDIYLEPTQRIIDPKCESAFAAPTQKFVPIRHEPDDDEPSIYDQPTQAYMSDHPQPQTSHEYSASASILNSSANTTTGSPSSNKENHQQSNQNDKPSATKINPIEKTPCVSRVQRSSSSTMEFDTPQYDFLQLADPAKIRQLEAEMSRKKAKIRYLFQDSSDESDSDNEPLMAVAVATHTTRSRMTKSKGAATASTKDARKVETSTATKHPTRAVKKSGEETTFLMPTVNVQPKAHQDAKGLIKDGSIKRVAAIQAPLLSTPDSSASPLVRKRLRGREVIVNKTTKNLTKKVANFDPVVKLQRLPSKMGVAKPNAATAQQPRILFTIVDPRPHAETIDIIGAALVDLPNMCTVLVTNKVYRTYKFLSAMGRGTPIVSEAWITECAQQRRYVEPGAAFVLKDVVSEKRYKFDLAQTLARAREKPIFANYSFVITASTKPMPHELRSIITCAGGHAMLQLETDAPRPGDTVVAVSCKDDREMWPKILGRHPGTLIFGTEGLMLSVMQYRIHFKPFKLK